MDDQPHLHVSIEGPTEPGDWETPYVVAVICGHGRTKVHWRRSCRNGCHRGPPARAAHCVRVSPSPELLTEMGILGHARRWGCGCDESYWMQHGPLHAKGGRFEIQPLDTRPDARAWGELLASGPSPDPWAPVC